MNVQELRGALGGEVLSPADGDYDAARICFNALIDRRPAAIARCESAADIAAALGFAQANGLEVAVRGGGHNPAGHCVLDDGLVIDLTRMRRVEVDAERRIARVEGGATWLDCDTATQAHGLAVPGGVVVTTGVCGLAMGGGIGYLTTQHGLTCDYLVAAELVTPDGSTVRASAEENPELLWALRGAGGNFGVVTALEFETVEVSRVLGGALRFLGDGARDALRTVRDVVATSPAGLNCHAVAGVDVAGAPILTVLPCLTDPAAHADELGALRAQPGLVQDALSEHDFLDQQRLINSGYGTNRHYWKGQFLRELPDEAIDELFERLVEFGRPDCEVLFEPLHGAPKGVDAGSAAIGWREAAFNVTAQATWRDPALDDEHRDWARATAAALEPWAHGGGYVNYMQGDEPIERVRAAFGAESFDRLRALKARYDPNNVLRRNQNVPPAESSAT